MVKMDWRELIVIGEIRGEWIEMMDYAWRLVYTVKTPNEFEEKMFYRFSDFFLSRADQTYPIDVGIAISPDYNACGLKYDPPKDGQPKENCIFHIANAIAPQSIFDSHDYLPECFFTLMDKSEKEYGFTVLTTSSWLNDPRWLALFPDEWIENLSPTQDNLSLHFGYWGQMATARYNCPAKTGDRHATKTIYQS